MGGAETEDEGWRFADVMAAGGSAVVEKWVGGMALGRTAEDGAEVWWMAVVGCSGMSFMVCSDYDDPRLAFLENCFLNAGVVQLPIGPWVGGWLAGWAFGAGAAAGRGRNGDEGSGGRYAPLGCGATGRRSLNGETCPELVLASSPAIYSFTSASLVSGGEVVETSDHVVQTVVITMNSSYPIYTPLHSTSLLRPRIPPSSSLYNLAFPRCKSDQWSSVNG